MQVVRFGVIGCGLMGREFASAAMRWAHLTDIDVRPEIVSACDASEKMLQWFVDNVPTVKQSTADYREVLDNPEVDAVYIAIPHNLHQEVYCAAIDAGKHLMGEKPFGIDKPACDTIMAKIAERPDVFVRCSSEVPFAPAMQRLCRMIESGECGEIIEVNTGFLHSSDLDTSKPINWKRMIRLNGEYGCLGDLGMHACHVPFKAGWVPNDVRAVLSKLVPTRPDGKGGTVPCETWDNAILLCKMTDPATGKPFPWTMKTQRIAPGEKNNWYCEVLGMRKSVRFSSKNINEIRILEYTGGDQAWQIIDTGYETTFKAVSAGIFQFGFSDTIQQMWAGFCYELVHGESKAKFAQCVTPEEAALSHKLFTAALASHANNTTVEVV